jgi:formyltetrahydrofolate deformylase
MSPTATLLVTCPEAKGLVAKLATFVADHSGNIVQADHHTDFEAGLFLSRIEWEVEGFDLPRAGIHKAFQPLATDLKADWSLRFSDQPQRLAIFVSKQDHCLVDLLWRIKSGELAAEAPIIVGNHPELGEIAQQFGIKFHHIPTSAGTKAETEKRQLELLKQHDIELVVLAKYMQILSEQFLAQGPPVINIHHSFLPAFVGEKPYHKAHARGVKLIGATAHYTTVDLDEGPIIEQEVARVSHRDNVSDLIRLGRDVERVVLSRAVRKHVENRVLIYGNRTVVFD